MKVYAAKAVLQMASLWRISIKSTSFSVDLMVKFYVN